MRRMVSNTHPNTIMPLPRPLNAIFLRPWTTHHCSYRQELWWNSTQYSQHGVVWQPTLPANPRYWWVDGDPLLESQGTADDFYTTIEQTLNGVFQNRWRPSSPRPVARRWCDLWEPSTIGTDWRVQTVQVQWAGFIGLDVDCVRNSFCLSFLGCIVIKLCIVSMWQSPIELAEIHHSSSEILQTPYLCLASHVTDNDLRLPRAIAAEL